MTSGGTARRAPARRAWLVHRSRGALTAAVLSVICVGSGSTAFSPSTASASPRVPATQRLVVLRYQHDAYRYPRPGAPVIARLSARRPITGEPTTLPVLGEMHPPGRFGWLNVRLPGRPNGTTGWIHRGGSSQIVTSWHIVVGTAARRVWVYFAGRLLRSFPAVVGKPATPTPTGAFFVEETVAMPTRMPGGPFALATSARSGVLQEFDGGPGQIAIHGRDGLGGDLGQAESHGCVRLDTPTIDWLAARIGPGVPVDIR